MTRPPAADTAAQQAAEPVPQSPPAAAAVFGERLPLAQRYAERLAGDGVTRGLIGPREVPRLWERHVLNCAVVADLLPVGARVVDVGSGAGLPGLPLAIRRPDLLVTLVEPLLRRTGFLSEVVDELGLTQSVRVLRGRAQDVVGEVAPASWVVSRAVAPLPRLVTWCAPLLAADGVLLALKGSRAGEELSQARPALRAAGLTDATVQRSGAEVLREPTYVVVARRGTLGVQVRNTRRRA